MFHDLEQAGIKHVLNESRAGSNDIRVMLERLAHLVYTHRVELGNNMCELECRFDQCLVDDTDHDLLSEMLHYKYRVYKHGPEKAPMLSVWPGYEIERLVNEVNAARSKCAQEAQVALSEMRTFTLHMQMRVQMEYIRLAYHRTVRISLSRKRLVDALVYELRHVLRAEGARNFDMWLRNHLELARHGWCPELTTTGKSGYAAPLDCTDELCEAARAARAVKCLLDRAKDEVGPKMQALILDRLGLMTSTFWAPAARSYATDWTYMHRIIDIMRTTSAEWPRMAHFKRFLRVDQKVRNSRFILNGSRAA